MPAPRYRSRSLMRIRKTTPSGINKLTYKERKPKQAHCSGCGTVLKGIPRFVKDLPKSMKRPERPYGGMLCSRCMRIKMVERARQNV